MGGLSEIADAKTGGGSVRRLLLGVGLLAVGAVIAVVGFALVALAAPSGRGGSLLALRVGTFFVGLLVPAALFAVFRWVPTTRRLDGVAISASGIALLGLLAFSVAVPPASPGVPEWVRSVGFGFYGLGILAVLGTLLVAVVRTDRSGSLPQSSTASTGRRSDGPARAPRPGRSGARYPADGGEADDGLYFPLDDDPDRRDRDR